MFTTFSSAEPKKRKTSSSSSSSDTPNVAEVIEKLESSRHNERRRFKTCIKAAEKLYSQVYKFMIKLRSSLKDKNILAKIGVEGVIAQARVRYLTLLSRLGDLGALTWHEQTRGPTSSRSFSVGTPEEGDEPALWVLFTPPPERCAPDSEQGRTLNESDGPWLTWGLPRRLGVISLDTEAFTRGKPVFVIEKGKVEVDGKQRVQHRIKGLYFIFRDINETSTKVSMMTWEHVIDGWMSGEKNEKKAPKWAKK